MAKIGKIQEVAIKKLVPYEKNAKIHSREQVRKIADSIQEFGFLNPVLVDNDMNVVAGHGRIEAAKLLGMKTVPVINLDGLSEEQRRAYILADNKLGELAEWDMALVSEELNFLSENGFDVDLTGFTVDDEIVDTADIDEFPLDEEMNEMLQEKPVEIKRGDVYKLGDHVLMCGDSTNISDVMKLCEGGGGRPSRNRSALQCGSQKF